MTPSDTERPTSARQMLAPGDLAARQLEAIDSFNRAYREARAAAASLQGSREMRLDAARRLDVLRRQHAAVVARTDAVLHAEPELFLAGSVRTLVVHRDAWFGRKISFALVDEGFAVLAQLDNGADAVGMVIAEQPDLLLLEDPLPMMTAEQVVREVRRYSPDTCVAVQAIDATGMAGLLDAGASSVFTRQIPPAEVARSLAGALLPVTADPVAAALRLGRASRS